MSDEATLKAFLRWLAEQNKSPYGTVAYWVDQYLKAQRNDGEA